MRAFETAAEGAACVVGEGGVKKGRRGCEGRSRSRAGVPDRRDRRFGGRAAQIQMMRQNSSPLSSSVPVYYCLINSTAGLEFFAWARDTGCVSGECSRDCPSRWMGRNQALQDVPSVQNPADHVLAFHVRAYVLPLQSPVWALWLQSSLPVIRLPSVAICLTFMRSWSSLGCHYIALRKPCTRLYAPLERPDLFAKNNETLSHCFVAASSTITHVLRKKQDFDVGQRRTISTY